MWKANTDSREGSEQAAAWEICQSPETWGKWETPGAVPSWKGQEKTTPCLPQAAVASPGCCPALHQHNTICLQSGISTEAPPKSNSSSNSVHVPSPRQSSETFLSCTSHPSQAAPEPLPFQVLQQEEEGDEVGVRQRAEKVHHAVLLGSRIREGWRQRGRGLRTGSGAAAGPTAARYLPAASA